MTSSTAVTAYQGCRRCCAVHCWSSSWCHMGIAGAPAAGVLHLVPPAAALLPGFTLSSKHASFVRLSAGITSESDTIYVQCQCPSCAGKPSPVGLHTLVQHVEHVTDEEMPANLCRTLLFFQAEGAQVKGPAAYHTLRQTLLLWVIAVNGQLCCNMSSPSAPFSAASAILNSVDQSGHHGIGRVRVNLCWHAHVVSPPLISVHVANQPLTVSCWLIFPSHNSKHPLRAT